MPDQIIDAEMARALQAGVVRTHPLFGWIVMRDPPDYPDRFTARLLTDRQAPYVLLADTVDESQAMLPAGLVQSDRQPGDLPEVVEIWFPE